MLFYKVLILFWGCTRTCSHAWWFENHIFSHNLHYYNSSPQPDTNGSISSGFDEGPPSKKRNVLWLVSCPSALWLANSWRCFSTAPPLAKTAILLYQFRPWEYWGSCRTFASMDIVRHIKLTFIRHYMRDEMKMTSIIFWKQSVSIRNTVI